MTNLNLANVVSNGRTARANLKTTALATALASALTFALASTALFPGAAYAQTATPAASAAVRGLPDFADLAEAISPSVDNIRTVEKRSSAASGPGGGMDEEMQEFFRRFFGDRVPSRDISITRFIPIKFI